MKVLLVIIAVLAVIAGIVLLVMHFVTRDDKNAPSVLKSKTPGFAALIVGLVLGLTTAYFPFVSVNDGNVGIVLKFKEAQPTVLEPGLHWYNPVTENVIEWSTQILKSSDASQGSTKDIQQVTIKWALNWRIDRKNVIQVYKTIGNDIESRVIDPAMQEAIKAVSARYTAEELITQREQMRTEVKTSVAQKLARYGLTVEEFSVTDFSFSNKFTNAIEAKQEAEQLAAKAKNDLDRIRVEAEQKVAQAQAEAAALRAQKQEITPELLELRKIEMQREAIQKWDGQLPQNTGGYVPFLNLGGK